MRRTERRRRGFVRTAGTVVLCALGVASSGSLARASTLALDEALVEDALERAASLGRVHSILVARGGVVQVERVFAGPGLDRPANIKSLAKTVLSALVGIAIDRGVFVSVDQSVVDLLGGVVPSGADPRVAELTVGQLLSMQAGLERTSGANYGRWVSSEDWVHHVLTRPFVDVPDGRMLYSTGNSHVLSAALTRAAGRSTRELALEWLGQPLAIDFPPWPRDPQGIYFGGNDMLLSPRALLRLGELYRLGGVHDGEQIIPAEWIARSWIPRGRSQFNNDGYGYGWFITELADHRVYYGWGFGGQVLYVIPDLDMTVVITSDPTPPGAGTAFLRRLGALLSEGFIPAAHAAD